MHRFTSAEGIEFIKKFEGFRHCSYICPGNYRTIGYGHKLLPNEQFKTISIMEAEDILRKDLISAEKSVIRNINVELSDNQFNALVSFTYNLGSAALQRSTLRQKINYEIFDEVSNEFLKWVFAGHRIMPGLVRRRQAESKLFFS